MLHLKRAIETLGEPTDEHDRSLLARLLCSFADEIVRQGGDFSVARDHYQRSLKVRMAMPVRDDNGIARVYGGLGRAEYVLGNHTAAAEWFSKDLELAAQLGDQRSVAQMHSWLGCCLVRQGQAKQAVKSFCRSLELCRLGVDEIHARIGMVVAARAAVDAATFEQNLRALKRFAASDPNVDQLVSNSPLASEIAEILERDNQSEIVPRISRNRSEGKAA